MLHTDSTTNVERTISCKADNEFRNELMADLFPGLCAYRSCTSRSPTPGLKSDSRKLSDRSATRRLCVFAADGQLKIILKNNV